MVNPNDAASSIRTTDRITMPLGSGVQPQFLPQQASTLLSPAMRNSDEGMVDMPYIEGPTPAEPLVAGTAAA
ncbi:hypothetical protein CCUS01_10597 [Colletotrichum cuscutae]|uniref:Uncharacterized protein n=1 Tax=Colletotrichum cuscutae TaxID=1209917 RepID=A0AAI9UC60_9PEZI|nr:hypothetical protein CCUS01_10597 [Colletotrichum cuscutae]